MLQVIDAHFKYAHLSPMLFQDVNLSVGDGQILCILGPNGVGKTTLLKCIAGLLPLQSGQILCEGRSIAHMSRRQVARAMAFVPQNHHPVFAYTVIDTVLMGRTPHLRFLSPPSKADYRIAWQAIETLQIPHLAEKAYSEISGGERQLVLFARVLAQQPRLIILDEPTAHLDYGNQVKILRHIQLLAKGGTGIIMTSHDPDHALWIAEQVVLFGAGRVQAGGPPQSVLTQQNLASLYGIPINLVRYGDVRICVPCLPGMTLATNKK